MTIQTARLDLIPMTPPVLRALLAGDRAGASELLGIAVPEGWEVWPGALALRLRQLEEDPALQPWLMRAVSLRSERVMVGDIGFHTAPGPEYLAELAAGGVEFGFGVMEPWRRQGIATEESEALMRWAWEEHGVRRFVLSISPDNHPSRALAAKLGFRKIGSHVDEEDGPEDVFGKEFVVEPEARGPSLLRRP